MRPLQIYTGAGFAAITFGIFLGRYAYLSLNVRVAFLPYVLSAWLWYKYDLLASSTNLHRSLFRHTFPPLHLAKIRLTRTWLSIRLDSPYFPPVLPLENMAYSSQLRIYTAALVAVVPQASLRKNMTFSPLTVFKTRLVVSSRDFA